MIKLVLAFLYVSLCCSRNLNVETFICCKAGIRCGMFVEDCCEYNFETKQGCWWYFWCNKVKDTNNCERVKNLLSTFYDYNLNNWSTQLLLTLLTSKLRIYYQNAEPELTPYRSADSQWCYSGIWDTSPASSHTADKSRCVCNLNTGSLCIAHSTECTCCWLFGACLL